MLRKFLVKKTLTAIECKDLLNCLKFMHHNMFGASICSGQKINDHHHQQPKVNQKLTKGKNLFKKKKQIKIRH